jgi:hypothetical protein
MPDCQRHADGGVARGGRVMVADQPAGEARVDRRQARAPARYAVFHMAEVAVLKELFEQILRLIDGLRPRPAPEQG